MNIETNHLLRPELADSRHNEAITLLLSMVAQSIISLDDSSEDPEVTSYTLAGTHAEVNNHLLDPDQYKSVKASLGNVNHPDIFINKVLTDATKYDPDFDFYVRNNNIQIKEISSSIISRLHSHDQESFSHESYSSEEEMATVLLNPEYMIMTRLAPVSLENDKSRLHVQLVHIGEDTKNNCLHVDFTQPPVNRNQELKERRINNKGLADLVQNPVSPTLEGFQVSANRRSSQLYDNESLISLNQDRDDSSFLEVTLRNLRKIISSLSSNQEFAGMFRGIFVDEKTQLRIEKYCQSLDSNIENLSVVLLETYYRELLVAAAWNAKHALTALSQSHLDELFFGTKINPDLYTAKEDLPQISQFLSFLDRQNINLTHLISLKQKTL